MSEWWKSRLIRCLSLSSHGNDFSGDLGRKCQAFEYISAFEIKDAHKNSSPSQGHTSEAFMRIDFLDRTIYMKFGTELDPWLK